jgi:hypothetical protein
MNARVEHWAVAATCAWFSCAGSAEVLHYEFAGTVTSSTYVAQPGEQVRGTFSFDSSTPPVGSCLWNACGYYDPNGSMTMSVGSHRMSAAGTRISIQNDQGLAGYEDIVQVNSGSPAVIDGTSYSVGSMMLSMVASNPEVLEGTGAPRAYQVHRFDMVREGGFSTGGPTLQGTSVYFQIDAILLVQPPNR